MTLMSKFLCSCIVLWNLVSGLWMSITFLIRRCFMVFFAHICHMQNKSLMTYYNAEPWEKTLLDHWSLENENTKAILGMYLNSMQTNKETKQTLIYFEFSFIEYVVQSFYSASTIPCYSLRNFNLWFKDMGEDI